MLVVTYDLTVDARYLEAHPFVIRDLELEEIERTRIFTFGARLINLDPVVQKVAAELHRECRLSHGTGTCDYDSWSREGQDPWSDSPWCWGRRRWYERAEKFLAELDELRSQGS